MTVYQEVAIYLSSLLKDNGFDNADFTVFDLEQIGEFNTNNPNLPLTPTGLFSAPNDLSSMMLGGQRKMTIFRTWYVRFHFTKFEDRLKNEEYVEKFEKTLWRETLNANLPKSEGRRYSRFEQQGTAYPYQRAENNEWALYAFTFRIVYEE